MEGTTQDTTFLDMTHDRWSVRRFAPEQISAEHMARILEAGRNAPSACNYQPQRVLVLQSEEAIAAVRSVTHWAFNAPTVLLVCADLTESWKNVDGCDSAEVDAAISLDHMMMEAWECGVGSTWVRGFDERTMRQVFGIPDTWKVVAMMPMGYHADNAKPSGWHFRRKSVEELYRFL
ncbi:MAG: nitroreductase family protein [Atopobiaceae bacterium]|nr:nitroreductase family protein [Atopobiaceae bacterium]